MEGLGIKIAACMTNCISLMSQVNVQMMEPSCLMFNNLFWSSTVSVHRTSHKDVIPPEYHGNNSMNNARKTIKQEVTHTCEKHVSKQLEHFC